MQFSCNTVRSHYLGINGPSYHNILNSRHEEQFTADRALQYKVTVNSHQEWEVAKVKRGYTTGRFSRWRLFFKMADIF